MECQEQGLRHMEFRTSMKLDMVLPMRDRQ